MAGTLGWLVAAAVALGAALLFIPKQLWKRWRERIVDHLDLALRRRVSRFERRYREFVLSGLRFIDLKGLATVGSYTPALDEVFVDVSLAYRAPHQVPDGVLAQLPAEVSDRHSLADFLDRPQSTVLVVLGVPGSGKTTLLRHTALMACRRSRGRRRRVSILLYLRDHVAAIVSTPDVSLPALVRATLGRYGPDEPPGWFEQRLRTGDCVVLLDGLDEVTRQEDRRKVADWVERQTKQYPRNDFVSTSRPHGYRSGGVDGALVLQVRSFTDEQVTRFIRGWYLAVEKQTAGSTGEDVRSRAESKAGDLLERLNGAPALYDLTANPLLLTMIVNVHRYRGSLPGSRTDLYGEICQVMLWRRQEAKSLPTELRGDRKEALLRGLAFTMMQRRLQDLPRATALAELKPALRRMSTRLTEEDFLADVSSNGLLIERESGLYSFAHHTFQEYLAATHIRDKGLVSILIDYVDDDWWRDTILLYVARSDSDPIVNACLNAGSIAALSLAFDCDEQGSELAPELRAHLKDLLDSAHSDSERRSLMAGVLLTRHLRHQIRTGDSGRICARPISTNIYGLYVDDTDNHAPGSSDAELENPITGVQASGAVAFVRWVNDVTGGEPRYRLPNYAEINDPAVQRALGRSFNLSVWVESDRVPGQLELWTAPGTRHPHTIDAATLAAHVGDDINRSRPTFFQLLLLGSVAAIRDRHIDHTFDLDLEFTGARDMTVDRALHIVFAFERARDLQVDLDSLIGCALARSVARVLRRSKSAADWPAELARVFIDETNISEATCTVSLDRLVENVRSARKGLMTVLGRPVKGHPTRWARRVANTLEKAVLPIVTRQRPLTANSATAIRLAALCLAAEADARSELKVADAYREVAAGITLLERRANGHTPVTETIILARHDR